MNFNNIENINNPKTENPQIIVYLRIEMYIKI